MILGTKPSKVKSYSKSSNSLLTIFIKIVPLTLLNVVRGGEQCACSFFRRLLLHEKRGWRSENSWLFLIYWKLSENQKNLFFHSIFVCYRSCTQIVFYPHSSYIQKPCTIRVKRKGFGYFLDNLQQKYLRFDCFMLSSMFKVTYYKVLCLTKYYILYNMTWHMNHIF